MDIAVTVTDDGGMIEYLNLAHAAPGVVILSGDMNAPGKRALVVREGNGGFLFVSDPDRGDHQARVEIHGLEPDMLEIQADVSRYSLFIVLVARRLLSGAAELYRRPTPAIPERPA
jgi:hypothetical protein